MMGIYCKSIPAKIGKSRFSASQDNIVKMSMASVILENTLNKVFEELIIWILIS